MIISYASHKKIQINKSGLKIIVTKSPIVFRDFIEGFQNNESLISCLSNNYEELDIKKSFDFIGDLLLSKDIMRRYMSIVFKEYISNLDEDNRNKIMTAFYHLEGLISDSLLLEDLPIKIDFTQDLEKLLKIENFQIDPKWLQNPYDILETIVKIYQICDLKTIPVICNVANYLDEMEFKEINQLLKQVDLIMILIEFSEPNAIMIPENADMFYIDNDLVDWY